MGKISKQKLQEFVLTFESEVVAKLESAGFERNKYNVFDILNINRQELRHSDFLAFLMNPNRSGDIGKQFLQNFLSMLSKENPELNLDFFKMFYGDFERVIVKREYKHIDILLDIKLSGKEYLFVIENKVDSGEQLYDDKGVKGQLEKYKKIIQAEYKNRTPIFLFLSPDKRPPSESDYIAIDYSLIYSVLCRVNIDSADSTIKTLIQDYKKMIRGQFEMENDKELTEAALTIYNANPDIFDFIFENLPNRLKVTADMIRKYLLSKSDWITLESERQNSYILFRVKEITDTRNDLKIFFQIGVKELWINAYMQGGSEQDRRLLKVSAKGASATIAKYEWLVDNDKDNTIELITEFERMLLNNDMDTLRAKLDELLDNAFGQDGFVRRHSSRICRLLGVDK